MSYQKDNRVALENDAVRLDVAEKVTGRAKYTVDYYLPKMLWAAYIRSPFGNCAVRTSDLTAAKAIKGVLEVELTTQGGRYHGDRLGYVCAESRQALSDALGALKIEYDMERPITRLEEVHKPFDQMRPANNQAAAEQALTESDAVVEAFYSTQVQVHCPLEPHGGTVDFKGDSAVAYGSTQGTFGFRDDLARELGLRPDQVEFHCEYVGGGFGSKFGAGAEGALAARMSKKYSRPCRVLVNRKEEQTDTGNRPGSHQYMKMGVMKDGKIKGGVIAHFGSVGAPQPGAGGGGGGGGAVRNPGGRYNFGTVAQQHEDTNLNSGGPRSFRAPGHPQGAFAYELMMESLAEKIGMDPLQFRILNEISDVRKEMLKVGAEMIGWSDRKANSSNNGPIKRGYGCAVTDWGNGPGRASITVNIYRNGTCEVLSGAQDIGTGYRTMIGDVVRTHIGLPRELLVSKVGVSSYPFGPGSGGSVTSRTTAPRAFMAADMAKAGVAALVAKEWNVADATTIKLENAVFKAGDKSMEWTKACALMTEDRLSYTANDQGEYFKTPAYSEGVQFAMVDVDVETGIVKVKKVVAIQDCGLPVNRNTIENQITGAVIQGISFALFENRILNRQTGTMVNANMEFYKIAGTRDIPEIIPIIWRARPDAMVNSLGEPPAVPPPAAIACAVANAIGVQVRSMPLTPDKVLKALSAKERA